MFCSSENRDRLIVWLLVKEAGHPQSADKSGEQVNPALP